jgi:hypothetical protein
MNRVYISETAKATETPHEANIPLCPCDFRLLIAMRLYLHNRNISEELTIVCEALWDWSTLGTIKLQGSPLRGWTAPINDFIEVEQLG